MNMTYEGFVRRAFGAGSGTGIIDRWGDPAGLANTDIFNSGRISSVKAAIAYSMEIFNDKIKENKGEEITDEISQEMDEYVESLERTIEPVEMFRLVDQTTGTEFIVRLEDIIMITDGWKSQKESGIVE